MPSAIIKDVKQLPKPHPAAWFFPCLVLLASLFATFVLWQTSFREAKYQAETQLHEYSKEITGQIFKRLQENENILLGGSALFSVRGDELTRKEWHQYATALKLRVFNPGVLGFGFSEWIPQVSLNAHINSIRAEGFENYTITPPGDRSFYTSIIWLEPFTEMNQKAFGFDMYADPVRRTAMNRARDTGETSVSGKVILVQEGKEDIQNGFLMYVPCYRQHMPTDSVEQRQIALRGFVYSPVRMNDFMSAAVVNIPEFLEINIYDTKDALPERLLFTNRLSTDQATTAHRIPSFYSTQKIEAYGASWLLTFTGLPSFERKFDPSKSKIILQIGIVTSLVLFALAFILTKSRRQALLIVQQAMSQLLARQKLALLVQQTPLAVIEWNNELQVTSWNPAAEKIFGYSANEAIGHRLTFLFPPNEQERIHATLQTILMEKHSDKVSYENIAKNGSVITCEWASATLVDQHGEIIGAATLANDVTAARIAEHQLRTERNLMQAMMHGARNAHLVYLDRNFNFIHVNQVYARSCGFQPEEMIGKNHFALYPNKENEAIFKRVCETGEYFEVHDKPFQFPDQPERGITWWDWALSPVKDQTGEVVGLVFSLIETTTRKNAELALKASESQFRLLFEQHSAIMLLINPENGYILNANEAAAKFYGYSRTTLRQMNIGEINTSSREDLLIVLKNVQAEKEKHFIASHRLSDGSIRRVDVYTAAIKINQQQLNFAIIHDITERIEAEEERDRLATQNRQLQKAESLSRMAGAIAHHINNQLQAVLFSLEVIDGTVDDSQQATEISPHIESAIQSAEKASEVCKLLLTYLAKVPVTFAPIDLGDFCRKNQSIWLASKPGYIDFQIDIPQSGPIVNSSASQIQLLITNMLTNAWEASGNSSGLVLLTVSTEDKDAIARKFCFPVNFSPTSQKYACIFVQDFGCGISEDEIDQIFDPFYSTKFTGRGMGLSVVLGILRAHHGVITVESQKDKGSTFRAYLPIVAKSLQEPESRAVTSENMLPRGTILIVEDVPLIRKLVCTMLSSIGYSTLEAEDGVQALELFEQHQKEIVCVISDIVMPRMDGWQALKALRQRKPDIPVIFASGYSEAYLMKEEHDEKPNCFLEKPFKFAELLKALSTVFPKELGCEED